MAVDPPASLTEALLGIDHPPEPRLRWARPDHITLRFWSAVSPGTVKECAASAAAAVGRPTATAGPGTLVLGGRVLVVPVDGLDELASALGTGRPFRAHLTLARARGRHRIRPGILPAGVPPAVSWTVESIAAYSSELRPEGAAHHLLGRWSLDGG